MPIDSRWALTGQGIIGSCQLLQLVILARWLTTSDIGLGAIFLVLVALGQIAWDFGSSAAIIQRAKLVQSELSALHLLNILLALAIATVIWALAPAIAATLDHPEATRLLRWAAAVPPISAVAGQFRALHLRNMNFRTIAIVDMTTATTTMLAAVASAAAGWGAYSFVAAAFTGAVANSLGLLITGWGMRTSGPSWSASGMMHFLRYGAFQTGSSIITFLHMNVDVALLAFFLNTSELGVYAFAKQLCVRPLELMYPVVLRSMLPQMARLQEDPEALRTHFVAAFGTVNLIVAPFLVAVMVSASDLLPVIFGEKWVEARSALQILAAAHLVRFLMVPTSVSMMATGRVRRAFWWDSTFALLLVLAIVAVQPDDASAMAWLLLGTYSLALLPHWRIAVLPIVGLGLPLWISSVIRPVSAAAIAAGVALVASNAMDPGWPSLTVFMTTGLVTYAVVSMIVNRQALRTAFRNAPLFPLKPEAL